MIKAFVVTASGVGVGVSLIGGFAWGFARGLVSR